MKNYTQNLIQRANLRNTSFLISDLANEEWSHLDLNWRLQCGKECAYYFDHNERFIRIESYKRPQRYLKVF